MTEDEARVLSGKHESLAWQCVICGDWHPADHEGCNNIGNDNEYVPGMACISCGDTRWREWPRKDDVRFVPKENDWKPLKGKLVKIDKFELNVEE